ncbi:RNA helicase [Gregarina niphandrodes]|uniref:RNA helicase n=1 Tax=Gregarina niphandrodes TaxID=110365 RepID=A0A023BDC5_GRENI|nr:RNA helicase [Gregarina niphandrodes]EZG87105.1 RNA helicase [Gregarina niphandrodes]|eukprot:XP_011128702.1 RNA helicase [Gregarina niphandrodes]
MTTPAPESLIGEAEARGELLADLQWEHLELKNSLLKAVRVKGFAKPTIIQAKALGIILASNENFIGQAKNGSGKTAAFSLAALSKVDEREARCQALIIAPARELAQQNLDVLRDLGQFTEVKVELGCPPLQSPPRAHIISGTPGKIEDWLRRGALDGSAIKIVVLDEADTMLDGADSNSMAATMMKIVKKCPNAQRLLFSATFPKRVRAFSQSIAPNAHRATLKKTDLKVSSLCQLWSSLSSDNYGAKNEAVSSVFNLLTAGQGIVFCNTIRGADQLANFMKQQGFSVTLLVGRNVSPSERDERMKEFRNKTTTILVTTDVLARGIDVPAVNLVVNYDMPVLYENGQRTDQAATETYLHRVGRAGRMGRRGFSLSFIANPEEKLLLEQVAQEYDLPIHEIPSDYMQLRELLRTLERENGTGEGGQD